MTDSPSAKVRVRHRWVAPIFAFAVALTITTAAVRGQTYGGQARSDLVVSVDDGQSTVAVGREVTYRVTVGNNTGRDLSRLDLTMMASDALAVEAPRQWTLDIGSGGKADVEMSALVGEVPPDQSEIVVTACAAGAGLATACSSDVNGIDHDESTNWLLILMVVGQLLVTAPLVVLVVAAAFLRRKRDGAS